MPLKYSVAVRDARLNAIETTIGTTPTLEIRTLAPPATCASADIGVVLATITLPSDWMAAASGGTKALLGSWVDSNADATGDAGHFRIKQGATCHIQGSVGTSGADMIVDSTAFTIGQQFTVTSFTITAGNA